jgi:streptogramin lyase
MAFQSVVPGVRWFEGSPACVRVGETARLVAGYAEEPGSHRLWVIDDLGNAALSIAPEAFTTKAPGRPSMSLALGTNKAHAVAFDRAGNLWVSDIAGQIMSLGVWMLGRSGPARPRISWIGPSVADPVALAFDAEGGLWVASRQQHVTRFAPRQLNAETAPQPEVTIAVPDPSGLAFDPEGNLWVARGGSNSAILRYDANRLDRPGPPDATVVAMSGPPVMDVLRGPAGMAFDRAGNLWVGYFGPNVIAQLRPNDLKASGEVTPEIQLGLSVGVLLESLVFDEQGALWVPGESGQVVRLSPDQLRRSGVVTPQVTLAPQGLRYAVGLAINPAVSWSRAKR